MAANCRRACDPGDLRPPVVGCRAACRVRGVARHAGVDPCLKKSNIMKLKLPWRRSTARPESEPGETRAPSPSKIDIMRPRECIYKSFKGDPGPCPRCGSTLRQSYQTYLIATRRGRPLGEDDNPVPLVEFSNLGIEPSPKRSAPAHKEAQVEEEAKAVSV